MAEQVGRILSLKGDVTVTGAGCEHRTLKAGDVLHKGDVIHTAKGAELQLALLGGAEYFLHELQTITLDDESSGTVSDQDTALFPGEGDINDILAAIESDENLDNLLEETAAGFGDGSEGATSEGNSGTVNVEDNEESVTPVNYEFGSSSREFSPSEFRQFNRQEGDNSRGNRESGNPGQPSVAGAPAAAPTSPDSPPSSPKAPEITTAPLQNQNVIQITGRGEPGTTITISVDGKDAGQAKVDDAGNWSINIEPPLGEGEHTIVAKATDANGNQSSGSSQTIIVDAINDAPIVTDTTQYVDDAVETITITKADLLATARDMNLGDTLSIKSVTMDTSHWVLDTAPWEVSITKDGVTKTPVGVGEQLQQNLTAPEGTTTAELIFHGALASYHSPVGWFTVGADKKPQGLQIVWEDIKDISAGSRAFFEVNPGEKIGIFMVANQSAWFEQNFNPATMTLDLDMSNNRLNVLNTQSGATIKSFGPDLTMSTLTEGNDKAWDVSSGLKDERLYIGFDDKPGGDDDYNDLFVSLAFKTSPGSITESPDGESWTITKPPGYQGDVALQYTVTDGELDAQGTYTVAFRDGAGGDSLHVASDGPDVFKWDFAENTTATPGNPTIDTVDNFDPSQDKLNLADLLQDEHHGLNDLGNLLNYLDVKTVTSGSQTSTVINISSHGEFDSTHSNIASEVDQKIVLANVDLVHAESDQSKILQNLLKNLIVD